MLATLQLDSLWATLVTRLRAEVAALPAEERAWIGLHLAAISRLQEQMHLEVRATDGEELCAACVEGCCDRGRHHLTLVNALFYLLEGEEPPCCGFAAPCPQLGPRGCLLPPGRRPFNCVTFNCSAVEERLSSEARQRFLAGERELRALYLAFDQRYAGSSLRGLLNRAARLGDTPFLARLDRAASH